MRSSDLRHRVVVQERTMSTNSFGEQLTDWSDLFTTWAEIRPLSGRELDAAQMVNAAVTHRVRVRFRPEWANPKQAAAYRLLYGERIFNIQASLNTDERNREVVLMVTEGLNEG